MDMRLLFREKTGKIKNPFRTPLKNGRFLSKQGEVLNFGDLNPFVATT
jgi:hypothetical protein